MGGTAASQLASVAMHDYLRNANVDPNSSEGRFLMELGSAAVGEFEGKVKEVVSQYRASRGEK
jgi:hypothetical protein